MCFIYFTFYVLRDLRDPEYNQLYVLLYTGCFSIGSTGKNRVILRENNRIFLQVASFPKKIEFKNLSSMLGFGSKRNRKE